MNSEIKELNESGRSISIQMPPEETEKYFEEILKEEAKKMTIPGFRKGKAPISLIRKIYGDALFVDKIDKIAQNRFWDEIDSLGIEIVGVPTITKLDITDGRGIKFDVQFEIFPEINFNLEENKIENLSIEKEEYELSDTYKDKILKDFQFNHKVEEPAEIVESSETIIEIKRTLKDSEQDNKPDVFSFYLNYEILNPDFKDLFLNKKVGDKIVTDLFLTNSEKSSEITDRKLYEYEILKISKITLPELNDEFAKNISNNQFETFEALKEHLVKSEQEYINSEANKIFKNKVTDLLTNRFNITPPQTMVKKAAENYINYIKKQKNFGHLSENELTETAEQIAKKQTIWFIIKKSLVKQFQLDLTNQELTEYAQKLSEKYTIPIEKVFDYLRTKGTNLLEELSDEKVINFIVSKINVTINKRVL